MAWNAAIWIGVILCIHRTEKTYKNALYRENENREHPQMFPIFALSI